MSKQVGVPEEIVERLWLAECREDIRRELDALHQAWLADFKKGLLSKEALDAGVRAVLAKAGSPNYWEGIDGDEKDELREEARLTIEAAALQAVSIPEEGESNE